MNAVKHATPDELTDHLERAMGQASISELAIAIDAILKEEFCGDAIARSNLVRALASRLSVKLLKLITGG